MPAGSVVGDSVTVMVGVPLCVLQVFTRLAIFTEPRPVAMSYPTVVVLPLSTPMVVPFVQLGELFAHGTWMLPLVVS